MSGLIELQELAVARPGSTAPVEEHAAWYRAKARVLSEEARFEKASGHDEAAARLRSLALDAHHHAERLVLEAEAARAIPSARTTTETTEVI
ncbi:hypothetical protein [Amycolatopsis keratiniphila]|uniref:Uncharacterized protein n=1 Tax=Amycolatopsis keratiniphila TaxID=129921 RepID=W6HWE0_9PSEU|nr:hypothetical protein [Amycolatopsis keratiniphila]AHJ58545.1 hypothetical protein AORI_P030 [Amycolatopsis keratiniphila]